MLCSVSLSRWVVEPASKAQEVWLQGLHKTALKWSAVGWRGRKCINRVNDHITHFVLNIELVFYIVDDSGAWSLYGSRERSLYVAIWRGDRKWKFQNSSSNFWEQKAFVGDLTEKSRSASGMRASQGVNDDINSICLSFWFPFFCRHNSQQSSLHASQVAPTGFRSTFCQLYTPSNELFHLHVSRSSSRTVSDLNFHGFSDVSTSWASHCL